MSLTRYKLKDLITIVDERNNLGLKDFFGININKEFMPTAANTEGLDETKYKIVRKNRFVYSGMQTGRDECIRISMYEKEEPILVSPAYTTFEVTATDKVIPTYFFMKFLSKEMDRYGAFCSDGSIRSNLEWEVFCEIEIDLPQLEIQQRFVDIYTALVANAKSYEKGLEDLKLTFEAIINEYKRKATKKAVSSILREIDYRNIDGSVKDVQGINIAKQFMPSVANVYDIKLSKYKLVQRGQFAFSGMQTGRDECIRIALYNGKNPIIISPAYAVLEIKDDEVLAEYVMIWFSRKEIDRLGWFMSDSSIRTNLDMERFYEIQIPIPKMEIQRSIVDIYNAYIARKSLCENLKSQIKAICPVLIQGSLKEGAK
ncbi:restriction endonuclease subunit S [uncultured Helicobacter sp.]|uniref:restriction endonuclease subunit S n=1 Tax=uncultured Helicobacter sp. TaxID=175537 RepID=UPI0027DC3D5F|nr:restriction endonuclease subunit S [uncultured Helicobacter sp.]